jgi:hypothetical protein
MCEKKGRGMFQPIPVIQSKAVFSKVLAQIKHLKLIVLKIMEFVT